MRNHMVCARCNNSYITCRDVEDGLERRIQSQADGRQFCVFCYAHSAGAVSIGTYVQRKLPQLRYCKECQEAAPPPGGWPEITDDLLQPMFNSNQVLTREFEGFLFVMGNDGRWRPEVPPERACHCNNCGG